MLDPKEAWRDDLRQAIRNYTQALDLALTEKYSDLEQKSWSLKRVQSEALLAGTLAENDADALLPEAQLLSVTVTQLAEAVIRKGKALSAISSAASGIRQAFEAKVTAAKEQDESSALIAEFRTALTASLTQILSTNKAQAVLARVKDILQEPAL